MDMGLDLGGVLIPGGQCVPVRYEKKALVLVLQLNPVLERSVVVAQVQLPCRAHPRKNFFTVRLRTDQESSLRMDPKSMIFNVHPAKTLSARNQRCHVWDSGDYTGTFSLRTLK